MRYGKFMFVKPRDFFTTNGSTKLTNVADIDECAVITCLNGGTCLDLVANFSCLCELGFTGTLCETGKRRPTT